MRHSSWINVDVDIDIDDVLSEITDEELREELDRREKKNREKEKLRGEIFQIGAVTLVDSQILENVKRLIDHPLTDKSHLLLILESI